MGTSTHGTENDEAIRDCERKWIALSAERGHDCRDFVTAGHTSNGPYYFCYKCGADDV